MDPEIKAMAEARAKEERRSFAGFLEWLILEDAKRQRRTSDNEKPGHIPVERKAARVDRPRRTG